MRVGCEYTKQKENLGTKIATRCGCVVEMMSMPLSSLYILRSLSN